MNVCMYEIKFKTRMCTLINVKYSNKIHWNASTFICTYVCYNAYRLARSNNLTDNRYTD